MDTGRDGGLQSAEKAGMRALAVLGIATAAVLLVAGCASHQVPVGASGPTPLSTVAATQTTPEVAASQATQVSPSITPPASATVFGPTALPPVLSALAQQQASLAPTPASPSSPASSEAQPLFSEQGHAAAAGDGVAPAVGASSPATAPSVASHNDAAIPGTPSRWAAAAVAPALPAAGVSPIAPTADTSAAATAAADVSALGAAHQKKRALLMAYESKLRRDRAVINAYQRERRHVSAGESTNDRTHFLHRMLQDGLVRLSAPELLEWAGMQQSLADRGALTACSGLRSPEDEQGQAMSINALSVDEVAQYLNLSYQAIHNAAVGAPYHSPSKWRMQAAQINLAAQVVALIAQHPEDAKRLAIFEAEGEKKTTANKCWMAALGMRAALRLSDPDRDIILRTLVEKDAR